MDWVTFSISVLGSGAAAALINGLMNYRTQVRSIKESGLYAKRAEVLDEMMKRMERLDRIVGELVSPIQDDASKEAEMRRRVKASEAFNYFIGHYLRNRHYLSKSLSDDMAKLAEEYKTMFHEFAYEARLDVERPDTKKWSELVTRYKNDFPPKREHVANEFRKVIGVR